MHPTTPADEILATGLALFGGAVALVKCYDDVGRVEPDFSEALAERLMCFGVEWWLKGADFLGVDHAFVRVMLRDGADLDTAMLAEIRRMKWATLNVEPGRLAIVREKWERCETLFEIARMVSGMRTRGARGLQRHAA